MIKVRAFVSSLSVAGVLVLTACSKSDSPTAPRPSPTPSAATLTLTVSSSTAIAGQAVEARATVRQGNAAAPDGTVVNFTLPRQTCWVDKNGDNQQQNDELVLCYYFAESGEVSLAKATQGGVASAVWTSVTSGDVAVSASAGSVSASATVRFYAAESPIAAPRFFSINPSFGSARGGYNATISGQWLCKAYVNGSCAMPADVTMRQTFRVVDQVVVRPDGTLIIQYRDINRDVALRVVSFSGSGLNDSLQVSIPEADSAFLSENAKVAIVINNGLSTGGSVEITNAFEYRADYAMADLPQIFAVTPNKGSWQGGEEVTITGQNLCILFYTSSGLCETRYAPTVEFNPGSWAQVTWVSPDGRALRVRTPSVSAVPITQDAYSTVTIRNSGGAASLTNAFVYFANPEPGMVPVLYALSPNAGPIEGGTRVTIFGAGFQYPVQVLFNDREAQVISSNFNQIVCIAPPVVPPTRTSTPIIVDVMVKNILSGNPQGNSSNTLPYRYGEAMFVSGITPNTGYILGWTPATIYGQGFVAPVQVLVGGVEAEVVSVSGTSLQVKVPPYRGAIGEQCTPVTVSLEVTNLGSGLKVTGPTFTYLCSGGLSGP